MNGAEFFAAKSHGFPSGVGFQEKRKMVDFLCACEPIAFLLISWTIRLGTSQLADVRGLLNVSR